MRRAQGGGGGKRRGINQAVRACVRVGVLRYPLALSSTRRPNLASPCIGMWSEGGLGKFLRSTWLVCAGVGRSKLAESAPRHSTPRLCRRLVCDCRMLHTIGTRRLCVRSTRLHGMGYSNVFTTTGAPKEPSIHEIARDPGQDLKKKAIEPFLRSRKKNK